MPEHDHGKMHDRMIARDIARRSCPSLNQALLISCALTVPGGGANYLRLAPAFNPGDRLHGCGTAYVSLVSFRDSQ